MKLFLYEAICAGALGLDASPSLRAEGWAMLAALVEDFDRVDGVETHTLLDCLCPKPVGRVCRRARAHEERADFLEVANDADVVLVIAPESDDCLAERCRWVLQARKPHLGPSLAAIALAGDKWALARHFRNHGVPTPDTALLRRKFLSIESLGWPGLRYSEAPDAAPAGASEYLSPGHSIRFPAVCKPRHGAGSQANFLTHNISELAAASAQALTLASHDDILLQAYAQGQPASVTFLIGPNQSLALEPAAQQLSADGRFHYLGGWLPLPAALVQRARVLGIRAIGAVPGLSGMVGVDMVLGMAEDGSEDRVIEINPRPTTSYIGVRALALDNLAEALLRITRGEIIAPIRWRRGRVRFDVPRPGDSVGKQHLQLTIDN